jgi:RimJ/RimL family protein N-acetyltransferase
MDLDRQPTLVGPTLTARPLTAADLEPLYAVAGDPLLWAQHPSPDRHRRDRFEAFFADALDSGGALTVVRSADARVLGSSRFHDWDGSGTELEIGWTFLARDVWGGAANRELKGLMIGYAFGIVDRVVFFIGSENRRSRRATEKLGARLVGPAPGDRRPPAPGHVMYELTRADWARG